MRSAGPRPTPGDLHRATPWLWLHCEACRALLTARLRRSRHPVGRRRVKRCTAAAGLRPQGRDPSAPKLGRRRRRFRAVRTTMISARIAAEKLSVLLSDAGGRYAAGPSIRTRPANGRRAPFAAQLLLLLRAFVDATASIRTRPTFARSPFDHHYVLSKTGSIETCATFD